MAAPEPRRASRHTAALAVAALAVVGGLGGCAALTPHFEHPRLSLVGVEVRDATLAEQHFRIRLRVDNPNDRALPVRGIDYTLKLAGEDFGSGSSASSFTVPPHGEAEFEMLMTTNLAATLWKVLPRLKDSSQPLEYRLVGTVSTVLAFLHTIPFDEHGSFALR
jgi:LEA14-like dessication related protein